MLLSACTDARYRDGKQAVLDATKASELTEWKNPLFLNGLAAAYAEQGDFDSAVRWQTAAIAASPKGLADTMKARVEQYRKKEPFRMTWR